MLEQLVLQGLLAKGSPQLARALHELSVADGDLTAGWCACPPCAEAGPTLDVQLVAAAEHCTQSWAQVVPWGPSTLTGHWLVQPHAGAHLEVLASSTSAPPRWVQHTLGQGACQLSAAGRAGSPACSPRRCRPRRRRGCGTR